MRDPQRRSLRRNAIRSVLRQRELVRALRGFIGFTIAEHGGWVAIVVYAYARGGARESGLAVALMLLPAMLLAPLVPIVANRYAHGRVLFVGFAVNAVLLGATGASMNLGGSGMITYSLAMLFGIATTFARPIIASRLPIVAPDPDQLTAANAVVGMSDNAGALAGPVIAGVALAVGSPGDATLAVAAIALIAALSVAGRSGPRSAEQIAEPSDDDPVALAAHLQLWDGIRVVRSDRQVRSLVVAIVAIAFVVGAVDVGAAIVAIDVLGSDDSVTGALTTAFGLGALIGTSASFALIGRRRLARVLVAGVAVECASVALLGSIDALPVAVVLMAAAGAGMSVSVVSARTIIQGLASDDTLARLFGLLEGSESGGLAIGGVAVALLTARFGPGTAFAVVALVSAGIVLLMWRRLVGIDAARRPVDPALAAVARTSPVFATLPPYVIEQLFHDPQHERLEPGDSLIRRGDVGTRLLLVVEGTADVDTGSPPLITRGPGSLLGEIAVLRGSQRSADVTAGGGGVDVVWLDGHDFVNAVNRVPRSRARVDAEIERRLRP